MSTVKEERGIKMAAPAYEHNEFDPLVDLYGMWTPELADRYLPIPGMPPAKYECQDGRLVFTPHEGSANTYAADHMVRRLYQLARAAGGSAYTTLNIQLAPQRWIQPDFVVLTEPARDEVWVPADKALLVGECISPSSRKMDRINKPAMCAEAGIEYFMLVEVSYARKHAEVTLLRLDGGEYRVHSKAQAGSTFTTEAPFPLSFDPVDLLED